MNVHFGGADKVCRSSSPSKTLQFLEEMRGFSHRQRFPVRILGIRLVLREDRIRMIGILKDRVSATRQSARLSP
jgi:hypothetical protein